MHRTRLHGRGSGMGCVMEISRASCGPEGGACQTQLQSLFLIPSVTAPSWPSAEGPGWRILSSSSLYPRSIPPRGLSETPSADWGQKTGAVSAFLVRGK